MKTAYEIIDTILITEKNTEMLEDNKYVFKVDSKATKIDVARAVTELFDVKVKSVNIMNYKGKPKRVQRSMKIGRRANWRKAIVTLSEGTIEVF
jgi:large subunit ribosomal protein L23